MLFISGHKFGTGQVPGDSPTTVCFTQDNVVRDFASWAEARAFAAQVSDYIGNLRDDSAVPGTWVRFSVASLNIVGEEHDYVTLDQTISAVRSRSFIDEQFATDDLPPGSEFRNAYVADSTARLGRFGVDVNSNLALVGGESLFPKIAFALACLIPYLAKTKPMTELTSGEWPGKPYQRYLKIGWGWAKDLTAGHPGTDAQTTLVQKVNAHSAILSPFIAGLPVDGFLGDALVQDTNADKYQPLRELCQAYLPVLIERAYGDTGITEQERQTLAGMPAGTVEDQQAMFGLWRNLHFAKTVADAAARGVRYAGMGDLHRQWLEQKNRVPANTRTYDVTRAGFATFVNRTAALRNS